MPEYKLVNFNHRKIEFNQLSKADIIFTTQKDSALSAFSKRLIILSVLFSFIIFSGCGSIYRSGFVDVPDQEISGPIEIGPEWVELVPPKPLVPYGKRQHIVIGYFDYDKKTYSDGVFGGILNLSDGKKTRIEAFLFDENGESYELGISGTGGVGGGVWFNRKLTVEVIDGKPEYTAHNFPSDRNYTKLKIRSEIPLKCNSIEYVGSNPK